MRLNNIQMAYATKLCSNDSLNFWVVYVVQDADNATIFRILLIYFIVPPLRQHSKYKIIQQSYYNVSYCLKTKLCEIYASTTSLWEGDSNIAS